CYGTGKFRFGIHQGVKAGRHDGVQTCFEVSQLAELADDPPADRLDHGGDIGIAGRLACEKAGLAARLGAIAVDALQEDAMAMEVHIERTAKPLEKRHRPRLDLVAWDTACDRLMHVILTDRGANDRMDLRREVW